MQNGIDLSLVFASSAFFLAVFAAVCPPIITGFQRKRTERRTLFNRDIRNYWNAVVPLLSTSKDINLEELTAASFLLQLHFSSVDDRKAIAKLAILAEEYQIAIRKHESEAHIQRLQDNIAKACTEIADLLHRRIYSKPRHKH